MVGFLRDLGVTKTSGQVPPPPKILYNKRGEFHSCYYTGADVRACTIGGVKFTLPIVQAAIIKTL